MDNLSAVASIIWAAAGFVAAISVAIYLWRRPDSSVRLRHKESELQIGPTSSPTTSSLQPAQLLPSVTAEPEGPAEGSGGPPAAKEVAEESRFGEAYQLLITGNYEDGIRLIEEEARTEKDLVKQLSWIAFGQYLAAERGSQKALEDLRKMASDHQDVFEIQFRLGAALVRSGSPSEAEEALLHAYSIASSDEDRARALNWWAAESPIPSRNAQTAKELLDRSRSLSSASARSTVYARAARLYLKADPPGVAHAFALYELALTLTPADTSLRFDVAYAFADSKAPAAAFLHYTDLVERDTHHDGGF